MIFEANNKLVYRYDAEKVLIVTSGEKMALYAAGNINSAVLNFEDRGYASVEGIILNRRNVESEREKVETFARERGLRIVADIPRDRAFQTAEDQGRTIVELDPDGAIALKFFDLADRLVDADKVADYIIYFDFMMGSEKVQVSFHSFDKRNERFVVGSRKSRTDWRSDLASREVAYRLALRNGFLSGKKS